MSTAIGRIFEERNVNHERLVLIGLENIIWPILFIAFIIFSILIPGIFSSLGNIQFLLFSSAAIGALALAESLCLLSGNFDLSIAAISGFAAMFGGLFLTEWFPGVPPIVVIFVVIAVGGLIGLGNGLSVAVLGVNPFLQTLAFLIIFENLVPVLSTISVFQLPETYTYLGGGLLASVPVAIPVIVGIYLITWFILKYTPFGLAIYATGGNESSALEAGVNTTRITILVFVLSGMLSGFSGLLFTGYLGSVTPSMTNGMLFPAFAAAVIGGISLFGGRGNVLGAFGGVLLLGTIQTGLTMMNIDPTMVHVINGVVLLFAIILYTGEERIRQRILSA